MENGSQSLRESVGRLDGRRDVRQADFSTLAPLLDSKPLDVDMSTSLSGLARVYHLDGRLVVLVKDGWTFLREAKFAKDGTKVLRSLRS